MRLFTSFFFSSRLCDQASDGVWEFISSQEAVDIVTQCNDLTEVRSRPLFSLFCSSLAWWFWFSIRCLVVPFWGCLFLQAVLRLVDESTRRWKAEEDVIDDITCVIIELNG